MTESHFEKQLWVRSINDAMSALEHKTRGRRLSMFERVESQEKVVAERQILRENLSTKSSRQSSRLVRQPSNGGLKSVPEVESSPHSEHEDDNESNTSLHSIQQRLPFQGTVL